MNVYEAAIHRLDIVFSEFDNIYVSFSGGKDSGVLLNLCIDYIRRNNLNRKIGVFHMDYEAQYQDTTDYVDRTLSENLDIITPYRICLPLHAYCATSMHQSYWIPWEKEKKDIWVRNLPDKCIHEDNNPLDFFQDGMTDYDLQEKFAKWYHKTMKAQRTCCLIGIRTQESLNRWRAIHSDRNYKNYRGLQWTKLMYEDVYNAYPVFDWITEDVWSANAKFYWDYNKLYDLFYKAGVPIDKMRVASPFNDWAMDSLKLYRVIDPNNWAKMVGRVNGVNFAGIYGGTTAMGWQSIKLPKGHTWKSYMYFLLSTLPEQAKQSYLKKLETSVKFWREKGGCLSEATIKELQDAGVQIEVLESTNYDTSKKPVRMEYIDDMDIADFKDIPTYKRMCICIMKNDHLCKFMGFALTKSEQVRKKNIMEKYKAML
ncbi:tRNA(Ile)-lysidine synthase [termite gut metagenome]|uniref:tRNA(Ile)-lysidine synthase n=1 Tax=termite gut metagenome TaxID=433724 RepID=A0A5J4SQF9_9ZZZZ